MSDEHDPHPYPADPAGTRPKVDPSKLVPRRALPMTSSSAGTADEGDLLPERLARARTPGAATTAEAPHQNRFHFVRGALIAVAAAAVAGLVAVIAVGISNGNKEPWSSWKPSSDGLSSGSAQIASHIGAQYHLTSKQQLVVVTGGPLQISGAGIDGGGLPMQIALARNGDYSLVGGKTVLYRLCGLGAKCAIDKGKASTQRHLLLRRESLELSLYTFRYLKGIKNVVVFMPPRKGEDPSEALWFSKADLNDSLDRPLSQTLPEKAPLPTAIDTAPDSSWVDKITTRHLFSFSLTQANQDNSAFLVLEPFTGS